MGFLSGLFGGGKKDDPQATATSNYTVYDPLQAEKNAVATPLSQFLSSRVGQGVGEFPTDPNYTNRYNEFLSMNPEQYFKQNISDPAYAQFTKYAKPLIDEGYAGGLRGSGHYGAQEAGYVGLGESLGNTAATFIPQFAQAQLQQGQTEFARRYTNWYQSLPETNPVLAQAINFLNAGKQNTEGTGATYPQGGQGFLEQIGQTGLTSALSSYGQPTGTYNTSTGQPNTTSFGDATYKNPQFWVSLAAALGGACWVAAEIYGGWMKPRTFYARIYMYFVSPKWFKDFYFKFGEKIAGFIRKFPTVKILLKPLFDHFSDMGLAYFKGARYVL